MCFCRWFGVYDHLISGGHQVKRLRSTNPSTFFSTGWSEVLALAFLKPDTPMAVLANGLAITMEPKSRKGKDKLTPVTTARRCRSQHAFHLHRIPRLRLHDDTDALQL